LTYSLINNFVNVFLFIYYLIDPFPCLQHFVEFISTSLLLFLFVLVTFSFFIFCYLFPILIPILFQFLRLSERARTAKLVGASQECQVVIFTDSVFSPSEKTSKSVDIVYTDEENKAFVTDLKKMKGDDMFLSQV
jgi:hypothetical protein